MFPCSAAFPVINNAGSRPRDSACFWKAPDFPPASIFIFLTKTLPKIATRSERMLARPKSHSRTLSNSTGNAPKPSMATNRNAKRPAEEDIIDLTESPDPPRTKKIPRTSQDSDHSRQHNSPTEVKDDRPKSKNIVRSKNRYSPVPPPSRKQSSQTNASRDQLSSQQSSHARGHQPSSQQSSQSRSFGGHSTSQPQYSQPGSQYQNVYSQSNSQSAYGSQPPLNTQSSQDITAQSEFDGEDDSEEMIVITQDDGSSEEQYEKYGVLATKIVGVQYYNGHATLGEHVVLQREPTNAYDSNAIKVTNVQRAQIGHIPRTVASKLAKYLDQNLIMVDGQMSGPMGHYDCPLVVGLYGPSEPTAKAELKAKMNADKLPVNLLAKREAQEKKDKAAQLKALMKKEAADGRARKQGYKGAGAQEGLEKSGPNLEELMHDSQRFNPRAIGETCEKFGMGEDILSSLPMVDQPSRLATELLPYQRQGLAWLLARENPKTPAKESDDVVQLWKRDKRPGLFTNMATNFSVKENELKFASGGILADDMGLGKTLQIISLIVSDKPSNEASAFTSSATLIVAPVSVMSNWKGQMKQHVKSNKPLNVLIYHGLSKKAMKPEDFADYDVVITTYGTLSAEYMPKGKKVKAEPVPRKNGLFSVNWRRIVLDEGHQIRNPATKGALAATNLLARSHWVLTGTPIINNLKDLYSLIRFIRLTGGLERLDIFNKVLILPVKAGDPDGTALLQALMGTLCLRRRKDMKFIDLKLPELSEYVHKIQFHKSEQEKYEALQGEAKGQLINFKARQNHGENKKAQESYRNLLEILLRMRQVCNHWKLCGERVSSLMSLLETQKIVDLTPENRKALQDVLQLTIESREDCPVCLDELTGHNPVITHCGHIFGNDCITRVIETQHKCPMCRAELPDESKLVFPAKEMGEEETVDFDTEESSTKIEALLSILSAAHRKSGTKVIIFSQWTRFLDLITPRLSGAGYKFSRIDGTMSASARDTSLTSLDSDPNCTILLASLGVGAVGLNLTAANQVILCDSWWAPAIEDQAVDRVHRLGQTRNCTVWRLVVEGSIEERTLDVQREKRNLMMKAFQERESKRGGGGQSTRMRDIERLLG